MKRPTNSLTQHNRFVLSLLLLCLFCSLQAYSQTFSIPDANFRNCLKATYPQLFNASDEAIIAEAEKIKKIDCAARDIHSLEGIGYFKNVEFVSFENNPTQQVPDISNLTRVEWLSFRMNQLTTCPDLSGNLMLVLLDLSDNQITALPDLSHLEHLNTLWVRNNQLQQLPDLSANVWLGSLDVSYNPMQTLPDLSSFTYFTGLYVDGLDLTVFPDLSKNENLMVISFGDHPRISVFPDLTANSKLQHVYCSGTSNMPFPSDLSYLPELERFFCVGNSLTTLPDFSKNPKLKFLACYNNELVQLPDLSKCPLLETLECYGNNLTALPDLSNNLQLKILHCSDNRLTALPDLSRTQIGKAEESRVYVNDNLLTFKDIVPFKGLKFAYLSYTPQGRISGDENRTFVLGQPFTIDLNIDDNVTSNVYKWYKNDVLIATTNSNTFTIDHVKASDAGAYRATITNPDAPGLVLESGTTTLSVDQTLAYIPDDNFRACLKESFPYIFNSQDYVIVSETTNIKHISCGKKGITDLSGIGLFTGVQHLSFRENQIADLSALSSLSNLSILEFQQNNITALPDLTASTNLFALIFSDNHFSSFPDLTGNAAISQLDFHRNQLTAIPDLSGFVALSILDVSQNPVTSLPDLSANQQLRSLDIGKTKLATFPDLSHNVNLTGIGFGDNPQFSTWPDLSHNLNLRSINGDGNGLTTIPSLNAFVGLTSLDIARNALTTLPDLSNLTALSNLRCDHNNLQSLPDLSHTQLGIEPSSLLLVSVNHLTFKDLVPLVKSKQYFYVEYAPQTIATVDQVVTRWKGQLFSIDIDVDDNVSNNVYHWYKDGVLVRTTGTNVLTLPNVQSNDAGVYTCVITNADVPGLEIVWEKLTLIVATPPWQLVSGGDSNHVVVIPGNVAVDINGAGIETGDFVGIFFKDDNNTLQASGIAEWNGANTAITAWGRSQQGAKNGFGAGEEMIVRIWKKDEQRSYTVSATYDTQIPYTDRGNFRADGLSKILTLNAVQECQQIVLHNGWNLISTYIQPADAAMSAIFSSNSTVVVKGASGQILYAPDFGITSGSWNLAEGYLVYSAVEQSFNVCGTKINATTPIALTRHSYPAFLPYYGEAGIPAGEALAALGTSYSYAQVIYREEGSALLRAYNYIPAHVIDPPIDQIGMMKPGLACKIMLQQDVPAFRYPASISGTGGRLKGDNHTSALSHFGSMQRSTATTAVLVIPDHLWGADLVIGDEVAVFSSDGNEIGAMTYNGGAMAITLWGDESGDQDLFSVRLWRKSDGKEYQVTLSYTNNGTGKFVPNTLLLANDAKISDGEEFNEPVKIFPNPATDYLQAIINVAREGVVRITLYDIMGKECGTLLNDTLTKGVHQKTFDVSAFPAGHYVYKVNVGNKVTSNNLVIVK